MRHVDQVRQQHSLRSFRTVTEAILKVLSFQNANWTIWSALYFNAALDRPLLSDKDPILILFTFAAAYHRDGIIVRDLIRQGWQEKARRLIR